MFGEVKSLRELFEIELQYAYDCERKLVEKGLPTMIENAGSQELRTALQQHLRETQNHVARLEQVFAAVGIAPDTKSNGVFDKLSSAVNDSITNIDDSPLRDAALIADGNQVEHYEIALYRTLAAFARHLGWQSAVGPRQDTLKEEKAADATLTQISESAMNARAERYTTA